MERRPLPALLSAIGIALTITLPAQAEDSTPPSPQAQEAKHLANIRQVTSGLSREGEGYFSPDGTKIVYQAYPVGYPFYQIYVQSLDSKTPTRVSPGRGRTTCSYFTIDAKRILFASSHADPRIDETEKAARELAAQGGRRRQLFL